jgi:hypothetical protein
VKAKLRPSVIIHGIGASAFVRTLLFSAMFCTFSAAPLPGAEPISDNFAISGKTLSTLRNPATSEAEFIRAVEELGSIPAEPASTWAKIVGDRRYSNRRRKLALFELIKRNVRTRITLLALARLIPRNRLFSVHDIDWVGATTGQEIPKLWTQNNFYYVTVIQGMPRYLGARLLIVLNRSTGNAQRLLAALRGEPSTDLKSVRILDLFPVEAWTPPGGETR